MFWRIPDTPDLKRSEISQSFKVGFGEAKNLISDVNRLIMALRLILKFDRLVIVINIDN